MKRGLAHRGVRARQAWLRRCAAATGATPTKPRGSRASRPRAWSWIGMTLSGLFGDEAQQWRCSAPRRTWRATICRRSPPCCSARQMFEPGHAQRARRLVDALILAAAQQRSRAHRLLRRQLVQDILLGCTIVEQLALSLDAQALLWFGSAGGNRRRATISADAHARWQAAFDVGI